jgi:hypothetical protein
MGPDADEGLQSLSAVMATPVGRRWVLQAGLGTTAAAILGTASAGSAAAAKPTPAAAKQTGPQDRIVFQLALGAAAKLADLKIVANGNKVNLTPHTAATRAKLRSQGSLFRKINTQVLTHFVDLRLPRDIGLILSVQGTMAGETVLVAEHVYAPVQGIRQVALAAFKLEKSYRLVAGSTFRTQLLGLNPADLTSWQEVADLDAIVDPEQTAIGLVFKHPNVATRDQVATPTTKALLQQTPEVTTLGKYIQTMTNNGVPYGKHVTAVNRDGTPAHLLIKGQLKTFTTIQLNSTDSTFTGNMTSAVVAGVHGVKNTGSLGTVVNQPLDALQDKKDTSTWHTPEGTLPTVTAYSASPAADSTVTATVANSGLLYGTYTTTSPYANGQVPLKLYNNFVRWVTVYVQYLDVAGNNLSHVTTGPPPKWPDTTYAKSLGILPQIFTLLGVPIWDTNTLTATLDFPDNAVKANILFCGLGNGAAEGGWQQYFKGAYPADAIAPKNEVLVPALITGILSIGLTAFALCVDLDIATTWNALRKITLDNLEGLEGLLVSLLEAAPWATAAETFAMTVAAGAATYTDISANGGGQNVWSIICNALMSMLPKILMNPATNVFWLEVTALIFGDEAIEKAVDLIPIAGLIFAAIAAAGDAVTLAEAIGESAASPWVIGNSISLTYPVTVTVGYDKQHASTWPETATSWTLMAAIDGTTVLSPVTGPLNVGGRTGNSPIVFPWSAPFGGDNITWSISILDAQGNLVGSGSVQLPNNGATPPGDVTFDITELPETVNANSVFRRRDTVVYDNTAGGYTWSSTATDTSTRTTTTQIQEVTGVTVSTRLGVTAVVWKANDKYWLRGISAIEDATTLTMGGASKQGYARRPFVLFDPFVGPADAGNHVLLEPDDVLDGYHVRRLQVDATTGALTWRSDTSIGWFPLAIDAATLTTSGWVVTIHTDSGRIGQVLPSPTVVPPQARYAAGPGNLTGLLTAPTALTVTSAGTVIILNAGASELAAFDLLGSPVRCFGTTAPLSFTLKLPQATAPLNRTYLDVSVDGSGQIYVLSYTGTGSQVSGYRVDVYLSNGTPLVTNSTGMNVPHLAVDYWRSIHAANYTPILDSNGDPAIDPVLGVQEPSISRFDPS